MKAHLETTKALQTARWMQTVMTVGGAFLLLSVIVAGTAHACGEHKDQGPSASAAPMSTSELGPKQASLEPKVIRREKASVDEAAEVYGPPTPENLE